MGARFLSIKIKLHKFFNQKEPTNFKIIAGESPYPNQEALNNSDCLFGKYNLVNEIAFFTQNSQPTDLLIKVLALILKSHDRAIRLLLNLEKRKINHVDIASYFYYRHGLMFINRSAINDQNLKQLFTGVTDVLVLGSQKVTKLDEAFIVFPDIKNGTVVHPSTKASPNPGYFPFWVLHDYKQVQTSNNLDPLTFVI